MIWLGLKLGTLAGQLGLIAALLGALYVARQLDKSHQRQIGARTEQVRVETQGQKIDAKAQKRRAAVEKAPPAEIDAALKKYCRDCGPDSPGGVRP